MSLSEWYKNQTVIYWSAVMKQEAGVACFLTLAKRKYGCWELCLLAKHCHAASRHGQNYQRKNKWRHWFTSCLFTALSGEEINSPVEALFPHHTARRDAWEEGWAGHTHRHTYKYKHTGTETHTHTHTHKRLTSGLISIGRHHRCH